MSKKNLTTIVLVGCACLAVLAGGAVQAQQKRGKVQKLTGEDYAEIQMLSAKYGHAIDSCSDNGYGYSDLYTADGTFIDMWTDKAIAAGGEKWTGREKLREIASGANVTGSPCSSPRFNGSISHLILNIVIAPSPEGATGNAYMVELAAVRKPKREWGTTKTSMKTPDGWRIKNALARTRRFPGGGVSQSGVPRRAAGRLVVSWNARLPVVFRQTASTFGLGLLFSRAIEQRRAFDGIATTDCRGDGLRGHGAGRRLVRRILDRDGNMATPVT